MAENSGWSPESDDPQIPDGKEPVGDLLTRLVAEGRTYAQAEVDRQKQRATYAIHTVAIVALLGVVALTLLIGALVALLVGLILTITPYTGALVATLLVIVGALAVVFLLLLVAQARVREMIQTFRTPPVPVSGTSNDET